MDIMTPYQAITSDPPNVWLTSFYGFDPASWGFLGFSTDKQRKSFINRSKPGALVIIYGTGSASSDELGKVIGILQCSHRVNHARAYMSPVEWVSKQADTESKDKWELGVKAVRAWKLAPENRPSITEFANETYNTARGQFIGSQGMPVTSKEAQKILDLDLQEVSVFGEIPVDESVVALGSDLFQPSKAGPVSQRPFLVKESEGPKSLYVLKMEGDMTAFLGRDVGSKLVIKVGMSVSPATRCSNHNGALPECAFSWRILRSNDLDTIELFPNSRSAIQGENEMKKILAQLGSSLGGEFFLAEESDIKTAWVAEIAMATKWAKL